MNFQKYQKFQHKHYEIGITLEILFCKLQGKRTNKIKKAYKGADWGGGDDNDKNDSGNVNPKQ